MNERLNRRQVLGWSAAAAGGAVLGVGTPGWAAEPEAGGRAEPAGGKARKYKLGLVTYNLAPNWELPALLKACKAVGLSAVEFRTSHKHGVEPTLSKDQRVDVRKRCQDAGLEAWSLGSTCEFHSPDPGAVAKNIESCKQFIELARDIGAKGVKVRPNDLPKEMPVEKTLEQIGKSLRACGQAAADSGVEIWCEVHGRGTANPPYMRKIMDVADHPAVGVTWNSNGTDVKNGSVKESFELLRPKIYSCHINDLAGAYPYRELFALFNASGYDRYTLMEFNGFKAEQVDNNVVLFLRYYKALWEQLSRSGRD